MSEIKLAKNLEDLLDLIDEATLTHRECHELLRAHGDTASIMAAKRSLDSQGNLQNLHENLSAGLVDLSAVTFDQKAHDRMFSSSGLVLMDEPERRSPPSDRRE
jgi:hypothetical protein